MSKDSEDVPEIIDQLILNLLDSQNLRKEHKLKGVSTIKIPFSRGAPLPEPIPPIRLGDRTTCSECKALCTVKTTKTCDLFTQKRIFSCEGIIHFLK